VCKYMTDGFLLCHATVICFYFFYKVFAVFCGRVYGIIYCFISFVRLVCGTL